MYKRQQLYWTPLGGRTQIIERGESGLSPEADSASRVTIGHAEGMPLAFGNIYKDLAEDIYARKNGGNTDLQLPLYPKADAGLGSIKAIYAVAQSGKNNGEWVKI